jgi:hypothetical protein
VLYEADTANSADIKKSPNPALFGKQGGAGRGQGRKPGSANRTTVARVEALKAIADELTPEQIDSMDMVQIQVYAARLYAKAGQWSTAAAIAERAAAFLHPKLAAVAVTMNEYDELDKLDDAELEDRLRKAQRTAAVGEGLVGEGECIEATATEVASNGGDSSDPAP